MSARRYPSDTCRYASATISASDKESPSMTTNWGEWCEWDKITLLRGTRSASIAISHNPASHDPAAGGPSSGATGPATVLGPPDRLQHPVAVLAHPSTSTPANWGENP